MEKYNIENDKHILEIRQVMKCCEELTCRAYVAWRCTKSKHVIVDYKVAIQSALKAIPNVKYLFIIKKPFGFIFTLHDVPYKFFVIKNYALLRGGCIPIE